MRSSLLSAADRGPIVQNVQALRAVAAILVVLVHATLPNVGVESVLAPGETPWLTPFRYIGLSGVDLFFVISGFIMLVTNWEAFGRRKAGLRFLVRRAIRIYPPYWFAMLPVLAVLVAAPAHFMINHVGVKTGIIDSILLLPNPDKFVLTVAWTLVWEMLFYCIFAVILTIERRHVLTALAIWALAELGFYLTCSKSAEFYLQFLATPIPLEFIAGAVVGYLYVRRLFPVPWVFAGLAAAATAGAWTFVSLERVELNDIARVIVFGPAALLAVYAAVSLEASGAFKAPRRLAAFGDGSYAIYLWHLSILVIIRQVVARFQPAGFVAHAAVIAGTVGIVGVVGLIVFHAFEKPVTRYLNGLLLPRPARMKIASVALGARSFVDGSGD